MVTGLNVFRDHFRDYVDCYLLIGGAACSMHLEAAGATFRSTKDLDIVLCIESLDRAFVTAFWEFLRAGEYQRNENSSGKKLFYRFRDPRKSAFPAMLELFSRAPDGISLPSECHLTPIPVDEDISSLSAILMDETYYRFIQSGRTVLNGIALVRAEHLIPLKARAWLDLKGRSDQIGNIDKKVIAKHKNDVVRLYQVIDPDGVPALPQGIKHDMSAFLAAMQAETFDLKSLGIAGANREKKEILAELADVYQLR